MKNYSYSEIQKESKKKKRKLAFGILLALFLLNKVSDVEPEKWYTMVTAQILPVLTYEQQYGKGDVEYASSYNVPGWFYEDDGAENYEQEATAQEEQEKTEESAETLATKENGTTYTREQLGQQDFLLSNIFVVDNNTSMTQEELELSNLLDMDLSIENLRGQKEYKVLIYHTHGSESFCDSREGVKEDTIIGVGEHLAELLEEKYQIPVYHDETSYDIVDGVLDRSKAYENAYNNVSKILEENPSIEVVIDLHRDGVDEDTHLVTEVNGKKTAKIMFLNGVSRSNMNGEIAYLENPNKLSNLAFSFQMYLEGKENYGDYVRKIYVRSLRYNLHVKPRATLIEVGAQNNTVEEEKNAMEPLADILDKVLSKKE